jgi:hypothetical protein
MEAASVKPVTVEADLGSSLFAGSDIPSSAESVGKPRKPPIKLNTVMEAATSEQDLGELSPLKSDPVIRFSMVNITVDSLPTDPLSRLKSILIFLIETLQHFSFPGCDQITTKVRNYIQIGDLAEANNILCRVLIKVSAESKLIVDLPTDVVDRILLELTDPDIDELLYDLYRQNDEFRQETGALGSTSAPRQPQFYRNGEESSRVIPEVCHDIS